jgi:hypothetical protein
MKISKSGLILTVVLAYSVSSAASEAPFSGTWKLNLGKSQITGTTVTVEKNPSGTYHFDSEGFAYDFDLNSKEYPTPDGGTTAWKKLNDTTWEATNRMKSTVIGSYWLSLKGNTLVSVMKVTKPDGGEAEQKSTWVRVSGGPGFLGKWKSTEVKGVPTTLQLSTDGSNMAMVFPEFKSSCKGTFDGKDYVLNVAGVDSKETCTFERINANSFRMITKLNGKPIYTDVFTVSPDSKVLTDEGNAVSVNEPTRAVYERE